MKVFEGDSNAQVRTRTLEVIKKTKNYEKNPSKSPI